MLRSMQQPELFLPGTSVWLCHKPQQRQPGGAWRDSPGPPIYLPGTVTQGHDGAGLLTVRVAEGVGNAVQPGQELRVSPQALLLANTEELAEDMTTLTHLHEPGVIWNLEARYARDCIYTNTGSILIAVNPFRPIPGLFTPDVLASYSRGAAAAGAGAAQGCRSSQMQQHLDSGALSPHVYNVACDAYHQMLRDGAGQAILITGESGAGKTETSKLIMRCLANLGGLGAVTIDTSFTPAAKRQLLPQGTETPGGGQVVHCSVEQKVLESNPLLEAFGNAKTLRNDNSSRFGKYVEIGFSDQGRLEGAAVRTYLLERSRVVHVAPRERTFHAFYQLCAGASAAERAMWHLGPASDFILLNQSGCYQLPSMDDAREYQRTRHAMRSVGIPRDQQDHVFAVLAAVLHLGNVRFVAPGAAAPPGSSNGASAARRTLFPPVAGEPGGGSSAGRDAPELANDGSRSALNYAASLLGVPRDQLLMVLTTRTRQTPEGPITSPLEPAGAEEARDSLAKALYSHTFDWLVEQINASMEEHAAILLASQPSTPVGTPVKPAMPRTGCTPCGPPAYPPSLPPTPLRNGPAYNGQGAEKKGPQAKQSRRHTIGLLDIYGFESFDTNDLEQLCINLANEKLQQHFNQHVFKWEQAEYVREGIDWRYIEFVDNQEVLDLMEGRMGLLDLLDEQCRFPTTNAEDLATKYASTPSVASCKRFTRLKRPQTGFAIDHYAGSVRYATDNFLSKNKDYVVAEHAALLAAASAPLVSHMFGGNSSSSSSSSSGSSNNGGLQSLQQRQGGAMSSFKFDSVASRFKRQLGDLMGALQTMQPHYVRCIKPNVDSLPGQLDRQYVLQQLRCGGVMEAVRISCAGFAYKRAFDAFVDFFWPLCPSALHDLQRACQLHASSSSNNSQGYGGNSGLDGVGSGGGLTRFGSGLVQQQSEAVLSAARGAVERILQAAGVPEYQLGHTKVFLRAGASAKLDRKRALVRSSAASRIQAVWQGRQDRRAWLALREATLVMQACVRGFLARREATRLRLMGSAASVLQGAWRALQVRREFADWRRQYAVIVVQSLWRSRSPRVAYLHALRTYRAARTLQSAWRGCQARQLYAWLLPLHRAAAVIQGVWRADRRGEKLRAKFRAVVYHALAAQQACLLLQRAWRTKAALLIMARERQRKQRERFLQHLQLFDRPSDQQQQRQGQQPKGTCLPVSWKASLGTKGSAPQCRDGSMTSRGNSILCREAQPLQAAPQKRQPASATKASREPRSLLYAQDEEDDADDTCPEHDSDRRQKRGPGISYGDGGIQGRLQVLSNFQVAPLLQYWQQMTGAASGAGSWRPGRAASELQGSSASKAASSKPGSQLHARAQHRQQQQSSSLQGQRPDDQEGQPYQAQPQHQQQEDVASGDELSALDWLGLCSVDDGVDEHGDGAAQQVL